VTLRTALLIGHRALLALTLALPLAMEAPAQAAPGVRRTGSPCRAGLGAERDGVWEVRDMRVVDAVRAIAEREGWRLSFSHSPALDRRTSVSCDPFDARAALAVVLDGTGYRPDVREGLLILVPAPRAAIQDSGARWQMLPLTRIEAPVHPRPDPLGDLRTNAGRPPIELTADQLLARGMLSLGEALRGAIPGVTAWDRGTGALRVASVRGRGGDGGTSVKVLVDGIEVADPASVLGMDLRAIAQVQWIPGGAGAALYGTDALDGVLSVRTRADAGTRAVAAEPTTSASLRLGAASSPRDGRLLSLADATTSLRWRSAPPRGVDSGRGPPVPRWATALTGMLQRGDAALAVRPSYVVGGAWSATRQGRLLSATMKARVAAGRQTLAVVPAEDPALRAGGGPGAMATLDEERVRDAHLGVELRWGQRPDGQELPQALQLALASASREAGAGALQRSLQDSIRLAWGGPVTRLSARYSAALAGPIAGVTLRVLGDAQRLSRRAPDSSGLVNSLGDSSTTQSMAGGALVARGATGRLEWSAGVRGEWNEAFGRDSRVQWLPSVGAQLRLPDIGGVAPRARLAVGRSARAPLPGMSAARTTSVFVQLPNPLLAGERQQALEGGLGATFGGATLLDITVYRQRTDGFTQLVATGGADVVDGRTRREVQYRRVGSVESQGIEITGRTAWRLGELEGSAAVASARIVALDPLYRGVLRVGGRPLEAPQASYAVTWRTAVPGGQAAVTASGVGAWQTSAWGCVPASGGCSDQPLRVIPSLARLQATFVGRPLWQWQWRLRADNLLNNPRVDGSAILVGPGRSLSVEVGRW
jgi:hypothetical protein